MNPEILKRGNDSVTICVTIPLSGPMLEAEEAIQNALNEVGMLAVVDFYHVSEYVGKAAMTYFRNQKHRMKYSYHTARCQPIGSGVTEAACKVLIKQRFCRSGSRWKKEGASAVLSIRALKLTLGRWTAFWKRLSQYGYTSQSA